MDSKASGVSTRSTLMPPAVRPQPNCRAEIDFANRPPGPLEWRTACAAAKTSRTQSANSRQSTRHRDGSGRVGPNGTKRWTWRGRTRRRSVAAGTPVDKLWARKWPRRAWRQAHGPGCATPALQPSACPQLPHRRKVRCTKVHRCASGAAWGPSGARPGAATARLGSAVSRPVERNRGRRRSASRGSFRALGAQPPDGRPR